jgi:cell division cycle protein 20 (cofactor of APC complex)
MDREPPGTPPRAKMRMLAGGERGPHTPPGSPRSPAPPGSPRCRFIAAREDVNEDAAHYRLTRALQGPASPASAAAAALAAAEAGPGAPAAPAADPLQRPAMRALLASWEGLEPERVLPLPPAKRARGAAGEAGGDVAAAGPARDTVAAAAARMVPTTADRILDAPDLRADFYLNTVDWSRGNVIAVALDAVVYLWSAASGKITELLRCEDPSDYVASVRFLPEDDGQHVAVGLSSGAIELWDTRALARVRVLHSHGSRVVALAWSAQLLASGSREGRLVVSDVRARNHERIRIDHAHAYEICGLQWSPDGRHLASGGNDNKVLIWDRAGRLLRRLTEHTAAVKALAWCPTKQELLATGGGSQDRCIRIYNVATGAVLACVDTAAQVSGLIWHPVYKEIISAHGFSDNQLVLWKAPSLERVTQLKGHTERILNVALSPDGVTVVSAAGDETLRFWKVFAGCESLRKKNAQPTTPSRLQGSIR